MAPEPPDRDPLEELAAEFLDRQQCGQAPSIDEYADRYPDLAAEIRDLFLTILAVERLKVRDGIASGGLASLGPVQLERLGDYRILREIGRGGMGIVYEAEQESLGRRVAVKVLPPQALLDVRHLARFHREARIAGRLHHTNIVQVFGVGQQEGFHYYVMQFVRGAGLDRVIARLAVAQRTPSAGDISDDPLFRITAHWPAAGTLGHFHLVARIGVQAAEALQYAHTRGTLHRDIKPANLLIDENDAVYLTDFGLARALHAENVTQPGDITGTLRYVPPEGFAGHVGERGDIYSLGLTLYELLALRPAYEDTDRSSLIRRITGGEPLRLTRTNPHVPRDLQNIIAKATAHDPKHRYSSAAALADDLRRFLDDRPVQARRIGPAERLRRWARRNPAVASLSAATLLLLLAVAVVANIGYASTRRALQGEQRERARAEAVASLAQEALDRIFERLGPNRTWPVSSVSIHADDETTLEIPASPIVSKETAALLTEMLPFYDRLAEQSGENAALVSRAAEANRRLGDIRQRLGAYAEAVVAYRKAIELYEQSRQAAKGKDVSPLRVAQAYNELGQLYRTTRQMDEALQVHLGALAILEPAAAAKDASAPLRYELARTYYYLGTRVTDALAPKPPAGRAGPRGGPGLGGPPSHRGPGNRPPPPPPDEPAPPGAGLVQRIVSALPLLPPPPPRHGGPLSDPRERRVNLDKAITLLEDLQAQQPEDPGPRRLLALCWRDSYDDVLLADPARAADALQKAITILKDLVAAWPQMPDYRLDLCRTLATVDLRPPRLAGQNLPAAESRLLEALAMAEQLVAEYPDVPDYLATQAKTHHDLGIIYRQTRRWEQAERSDRLALACQQDLARRVPGVVAYQAWQGAYTHALADVLMIVGKVDEAQLLLERAVGPLEDLRQEQPNLWYLHGMLGDMQRSLAQIHRRQGKINLADAAQRLSDSHFARLREQMPPRPHRPPPR
jgi:serine/threonine protein kinase